MKSETVHLVKDFTWAGMITYCGLVNQLHRSKNRAFWSNKVNYWGLTGIKKYRKFNIVAFDHRFVTCTECLDNYKKNE